MQPCEFSVFNTARAFPNASPWVGLRTPGGSFTVRAFLHSNGYVYLVISDVGRWGGFRICNHERVTELFGPGHVMRLPIPRGDTPQLTISEAGLVYILARHQGAPEAAAEVLHWLINSATPAVKQAASKAVEERAMAAARLEVWGDK